MTRLDLRAGAATASILPELGGALTALRVAATDLLRPAAEDVTDPLGSSCFPLLPYANRIADGRFVFAGEQYRLPRNFGDHPHSLHGLGWQRPWSIETHQDNEALLAHRHDGNDDWPWSYHATQHIRLFPDRIVLTLMLTNSGKTPMPAGLGFHPYFPLDDATRLSFQADAVWLADDTLLPVSRAPADAFGDWSSPRVVRGTTLIDNCYAGWSGVAAIEQGPVRLSLTSGGADWLHLYRPPNETFFCVEPVTHMPDALNRDAPMTILAPGESAALTMSLGWSGI